MLNFSLKSSIEGAENIMQYRKLLCLEKEFLTKQFHNGLFLSSKSLGFGEFNLLYKHNKMLARIPLPGPNYIEYDAIFFSLRTLNLFMILFLLVSDRLRVI